MTDKEHTIEYDCECDDCKGTGVYAGMGERDGAAIICDRCKGTGQRHIKIKYREFTGKKSRDDIRRVYQTSVGICIGEGNGCRLEDFGGMPYDAWLSGKPFPEKSEDRNYCCPQWFYQAADYDRKPDFERCPAIGRFSTCPHFDDKEKCWTEWDAMQPSVKETEE